MTSNNFVRAQSDNLPKVTVEMLTEFFASSIYFNAAETSGVKLQKSQRDNYGDSAIGYVELKRCKHLCTVRGRVCPEHKVRSKPYSVECVINEELEDVQTISCKDCAASAGGCKHAVAFLMWLHRRSEEPAPTATECYWKKAVLSQVGTNIKFATTKEMKNPVTEFSFENAGSFFNRVVDQLSQNNCKTQISAHCLPDDSLKNCSLHKLIHEFVGTGESNVDDFLKFSKICMTDLQCKDVAKNTISQSESYLWMEMRYCRITASKVYEIAHCKTKNGVLVEQLIGTSKLKHTQAMERGKKLEKMVVRALEKKLSIKLEGCGLILSPRYPILGASPDAKGTDFVVEIKCPVSIKSESNYIKNGKINNKYLAQIQLQMFMCNIKKGYFCMAKHNFEETKDIDIIVVEYNESFMLELIAKSMQFWKTNIYPILFKSCS